MSAARKKKLTPAALGLRAMRGGSAVVAVALDRDEPRIILSSFIATGSKDDRLSLEPYHVAAEMKRAAGGGASAEAVAAVAEGRKRQNELAAKGIDDVIASLKKKECEPALAALLVNRAGWVTDLLAYSLAFPDHPPVAEGLAVRDALRAGLKRVGIAVAEVDEKSLPDLAAQVLAGKSLSLDARLKALGQTAGKPWRKEQKLACLAAWVQLAKVS